MEIDDMSPSQMGVLALSGIIIAFKMACPACASDPQINVKVFRAESDGKTDATLSFQKALDNESKQGGTVYVAPEIYRTGRNAYYPQSSTSARSQGRTHMTLN